MYNEHDSTTEADKFHSSYAITKTAIPCISDGIVWTLHAVLPEMKLARVPLFFNCINILYVQLSFICGAQISMVCIGSRRN